jgi:ankyrin repeat protein
MRGNTKICSLLLENNADPNLLDMNGISALRLAIYRGELQSIKLLLLYNSKIEKGMEKVACLYRNTHQYSTIIKTLQIFPILKNYIVIHQILEFL